jgi:glycosyltransferase involved in cell wall biosynthesis
VSSGESALNLVGKAPRGDAYEGEADSVEVMPSGSIQKIAFIGNHLPRRCGIATFTADLNAAVSAEAPAIETMVVAMNDPGETHHYPAQVRFAIAEGEVAGYRRAAQFLSANGVDVVSLQHEYGIFGGKSGSHVITLLRELRVPVVTTLHTILTAPSAEQRATLNEIIALSERIVVMSAHGRETLCEVHGMPLDMIDVIPHGIPVAVPRPRSKERLGYADQRVLLTFGLLSPDKGIEYVIDALPAILARRPDTVFVIVGATHPHVRERHGEAYRLSLISRARRLGVHGNVSFHDRFVSDEELADFLAAADVYVTPYLNPEQSTSGTLARAVAAGKAVVSTTYWHARELLAEGRGVLVPPRDSAALATAICELLTDDVKRKSVGERAAALGRSMAWPVVAGMYLSSFEAARVGQRRARQSRLSALTIPAPDLPELKLDHLRAMTDHTGLLQHATFAVPRYAEGYCLDDNARGALLMAWLENSGDMDVKGVRELGTHYLAFMAYAFDPTSRRFRNFLTYARTWTENFGSEDSHGHAVWALGATIGRASDPGRSSLSGELFRGAVPSLSSFSSPRAWAYGLLGIDEYLRVFQGDSGVEAVRRDLVNRLIDIHRRTSSPDWDWFENTLTYSNPRLAQSLIVSGGAMGLPAVTELGLQTLTWLAKVQTSSDERFAPVGCNGFYPRGGEKASFDQQPLEAAAMVSASLEALRATRNPIWAEHACRAFDWFLGHNHLQEPVYDATTGGCRDGLHEDRVNLNQGAESTLSFLLALVEMRNSDVARAPSIPPRSP